MRSPDPSGRRACSPAAPCTPLTGWLGALVLAGLTALGGCATGPGVTPSLPPTPPASPTEATSAERPAEAPRAPVAAASAAVNDPTAALATTEASPRPVAAPGAGNPLRALTGPDAEDDASARADLWERVRAGFAMEDLEDDLVRKWERWYASRPDYVQRMTERGARYLFHIVEEVQKRDMPTELALLPFIESAFNPQALSGARASGIWQFMPATGRDFELTQNVFRDDRRNVLESTRAALDYLQTLHRMFGDWHLALAAYNWGQGNVQRAVERNRKEGRTALYRDLRMPDETRNYVPKLQAVKNLVLRPQTFGLQLPKLENHPFFLGVAIERDIDVALAARLADMSLEDFQALNPQMNKPVILAAGTPRLLLPYDNANRFVRALAAHKGAMATWTAWVVPRTMTLPQAARSTGMDEALLREVNRIPPRMQVKAGSTLLVPRTRDRADDVSGHLADQASISLTPEARKGAKPAAQKAGRGAPTRVATAPRAPTAKGAPAKSGPRVASASAPAKKAGAPKRPASGATLRVAQK